MKEKIRKFLVRLKRKPHMIPLVVLVIAVFVFIAARNMRAFITGLQSLIKG